MPLERREVEIPLNGRLDTNQSVDLQSPDTLREVQNFRYGRLGELIKRSTYTGEVDVPAPDDTPYGGSEIDCIFSRGSEPVALTRDYGPVRVLGDELTLAYQIGETQRVRHSPRACRVSRTVIGGTDESRSQCGIMACTSAVYSGTLVVAYEVDGGDGLPASSTKRLLVRAVDLATSATIAEREYTLTGMGVFPTYLCACPYDAGGDAGVVISYTTGSGAATVIRAAFYDAAARSFTASAVLTTDARTSAHCIAQSSAGYCLAYTSDASGFVVVESRTLAASSTVHTATHAGEAGVALVVGASRTLIASINGTTLYTEVLGTPATVDSEALSFTPLTITAAAETRDGNAHHAWIAMTFQTALPDDQYSVGLYYADFTTTTTTLAGTTDIANGYVAGGSFTVDGRAYLVLGHGRDETVPSSLTVVRIGIADGQREAQPIARVMHDRAFTYGSAVLSMSSPVASVVDGETVYLSLTGDVVNHYFLMPRSVFLSRIDFAVSGAMPLPFVEVDGVAHVAGGLLWEYDGSTASECTPLDRPWVVADTAAAGSQSSATGVSAVAVYKWTDAAGRVHRSAPSDAVALGTFTTQQIDIYVLAPPPSARDGRTSDLMDIEIYLTEDGGSVYYLAAVALWGYEYTSASGPWYLFADVVIPNGTTPQLYSTNGATEELVSEPPPAFCSIARIGDRLWGVDAEDRTRWWATKPFVAGYAPEWNTVITGYIGDEGVAVCDANGLPVILGRRGVWVVDGEGPNALGIGSFAPPRRLPHELGCVSATSVCKVPSGVVFRSRRGYVLLDAGLSLQPVSGPVDALLRATTDYDALRVVYDARHEEVRVFGEACGPLVWNLRENKWSTLDTDEQNPVDACIADDRLWYVHDAGSSTYTLRRELGIDEDDHNVSTDSTALGTPLITFDGSTGIQRLWKLPVKLRLSDNPSNINSLTFTLYTDGDLTTAAQTWSFTGAELAALVSGTGRTVDIELHPSVQRVRSFALYMAETCSSAYGGTTPVAIRPVFGAVPGSKMPKTGAQKG